MKYLDADGNTIEFLTTKDVAARLRVDTATVRRWVKDGSLEAIVLPYARKKTQLRFYRETIEKLLNTTTKEGQEQ